MFSSRSSARPVTPPSFQLFGKSFGQVGSKTSSGGCCAPATEAPPAATTHAPTRAADQTSAEPRVAVEKSDRTKIPGYCGMALVVATGQELSAPGYAPATSPAQRGTASPRQIPALAGHDRRIVELKAGSPFVEPTTVVTEDLRRFAPPHHARRAECHCSARFSRNSASAARPLRP